MARRTNEARSAATRTALLDATVDCLIELGYTGATTTEISKRAGVSRGAQMHHFPSKAVLVIAAVEHLFEKRKRAFRESFAALPESTDLISAGIDLLWEHITGPSYYAWLELVMAARTDADLKVMVKKLTLEMDAEIADFFGELFGVPDGYEPMMKVAGTLLFGAMEGMATARIALDDEFPYQEVLQLLKQLAYSTIPVAPKPKET